MSEGNEPSASFDAAFDRGGIVAVAPEDREAYADVLRRLLRPGGKVLLVSTEHPPFANGSPGPPHSIDAAEVARLFAAHFEVEQLKREDRLPVESVWSERGCSYFFETTYMLTRRATPPYDTSSG